MSQSTVNVFALFVSALVSDGGLVASNERPSTALPARGAHAPPIDRTLCDQTQLRMRQRRCGLALRTTRHRFWLRAERHERTDDQKAPAPSTRIRIFSFGVGRVAGPHLDLPAFVAELQQINKMRANWSPQALSGRFIRTRLGRSSWASSFGLF